MAVWMRRRLLGVGLVGGAAVLAGVPALAREPEVFQRSGIAMGGTDVVAYFDQAAPAQGSSAHEHRWNGALWRFASAETRAHFTAEPARFAPEFGGYCAFAASRGYLAPTIPEAWTIFEGRLYLNASLRARELWLRDVPGNIAKGRANWPGILG